MWKISTCDNNFVGTFEECVEWFESDTFSPKLTKADWLKLRLEGKFQCGFPWGEVTMTWMGRELGSSVSKEVQ